MPGDLLSFVRSSALDNYNFGIPRAEMFDIFTSRT